MTLRWLLTSTLTTRSSTEITSLILSELSFLPVLVIVKVLDSQLNWKATGEESVEECTNWFEIHSAMHFKLQSETTAKITE